MKNKGAGVYIDSNGTYYERPTINGKRTWRKLASIKLADAREEVAANRSDQARSSRGLCRDPYGPKCATVTTLIDDFLKAGCPTCKGGSRTDGGDRIIAYLKKIKESPISNQAVDTLTNSDFHRYADWRRAKTRKGMNGGATVDLEIQSLAAACRWAHMLGRIKTVPTEKRIRFKANATAHCREFSPKDADELHAIARHFFEGDSPVMGFFVLLTAYTGCRKSEVLRLRWDAQSPLEPGYMSGKSLYLARSKSGVNPWCYIHPALAELLDNLRRWRAINCPTSPWFCPSPLRPDSPPHECWVSQSVMRAGRLIAGARRTVHGLRSFYVTVRRSNGVSDGQIAAEIGDQTGPVLISQVYGGIPKNWDGQPDPVPMTWLPKGEPAWSALNLPSNILTVVPQAATA